jgi:hypothetical protein
VGGRIGASPLLTPVPRCCAWMTEFSASLEAPAAWTGRQAASAARTRKCIEIISPTQEAIGPIDNSGDGSGVPAGHYLVRLKTADSGA